MQQLRKFKWWFFVVAAFLAIYFILIDRWVPEEADWYGHTGLSHEIERELPKYLRREFGETWLSSKYLKASDLKYLGAFQEGTDKVHFWQVPWETEDVYAHITERSNGRLSLGWGGTKKPPI